MQKSYNGVALPQGGKPIQYSNGKYQVPDNPIIPFIEGDGTGRDIWRASQRVFDAAVEKAYGGKRADQVVRNLRRREGVSPVSTTGCQTTRSAPRAICACRSRAR